MASAGGFLGGAAGGALSGLKFGPWGAAAGAALGGLGSLFGGSNPATGASNAIFKNIPNLINQGNTATRTGLADLNRAGSFYGSILGGDREAVNNLVAPQVSTVLSQYDNAKKTISQFAPRGGGQTAQLAGLPFARDTAAAGAYQGLLPGAASGLAGTGSATAGIGTGLLGAANGGGAPGQAFNYTNLNSQLQRGLGQGIGQSTASGSGASGLSSIVSAGKGLGGWLAKILTKGGSGGSSGSGGIDFSLGSPSGYGD